MNVLLSSNLLDAVLANRNMSESWSQLFEKKMFIRIIGSDRCTYAPMMNPTKAHVAEINRSLYGGFLGLPE